PSSLQGGGRLLGMHRNGPDRISARRKADHHRAALASIISRYEINAARAVCDALSNRRATVLFERGRIEHAIVGLARILGFALGKPLADHFGVQLEPDIRAPLLHPVPFAEPDKTAAGQP